MGEGIAGLGTAGTCSTQAKVQTSSVYITSYEQGSIYNNKIRTIVFTLDIYCHNHVLSTIILYNNLLMRSKRKLYFGTVLIYGRSIN